MRQEDYIGLINFRKIGDTARKKVLFLNEVAARAGISKYAITNVMASRYIPTTEVVIGICAAMECSITDVVEFSGFEIRDLYKGRSGFVAHKAAVDELYKVSYEPLRQLFKDNYKDNWLNKLKQFFDVIPKIDMTESDKARVERMTLAKFGPELAEKLTYNLKTVGLSQNVKYAILNDRPINFRYVYNICKTLYCTPDFVVTYK